VPRRPSSARRTTPAGARRRHLGVGAIATAALGLVLAACAGEPEPIDLIVEPASFDLSSGTDQRLLVGLFTPDRQLVAHGEVEMGLAYLGDGSEEQAQIEQQVTATYHPVPGGNPTEVTDGPSLVEDTGSGLYAARVDLDRPGLWGVRVVGELEDGTPISGNRTFQVLEEPLVLAPGDEAPRVENATIADVESGAVEPVQIDSRAQGPNDEIPYPHLHDTTVAEAIESGRPVVVAVATPVYCQSRFCGPLTDVLAELAEDHEDRAEFIHLEVWQDFESQTINEAAAAFIQTEVGGNEPWVFLIDGDGRIAARWDNLLDVEELTAALEELPVSGGGTALGPP